MRPRVFFAKAGRSRQVNWSYVLPPAMLLIGFLMGRHVEKDSVAATSGQPAGPVLNTSTKTLLAGDKIQSETVANKHSESHSEKSRADDLPAASSSVAKKGRPQAAVEAEEAFSNDNYTIVTMSYHRRESILRGFLRLYNCAPLVDAIVVVWNDVEHPIPANLSAAMNCTRLEVVRAGKNSMHNRFNPDLVLDRGHVRTNAVMYMDDDIRSDPATQASAFRVWQQFPDRLVGFVGRGYATLPGQQYEYRFDLVNGQFAIILVGNSISHRKYMHAYWFTMPAEIRQHVEAVQNCDDLAMNMLIANLTGKPPVMVAGVHLSRNTKHGVSQQQGHGPKRHECLTKFARAFGYMPLERAWSSLRIFVDGAKNEVIGEGVGFGDE